MVKLTRFGGYLGENSTQKPIFDLKLICFGLLLLIGIFGGDQVVLAHHAMGGKTPDNFITGFLSGLAHPVIGLDHLAFVVASGLLAAKQVGGIFIPVAFVITTILGTFVHLQALNLPFPEVIIAISVIIFGLLLTQKYTREHQPQLYNGMLIALAGLAGIFHGYAYGEAIIGAEMTPLVSYLIGFGLIQLLIAGGSYLAGKKILNISLNSSLSLMSFLGLFIGGVGLVFLSFAV